MGAHALKSLELGILGIVGVEPSRHSHVGPVEAISDGKRRTWLETMRGLGRRARRGSDGSRSVRQSFTPRRRAALAITLTEESAMAAAAMTGESRMPKNG